VDRLSRVGGERHLGVLADSHGGQVVFEHVGLEPDSREVGNLEQRRVADFSTALLRSSSAIWSSLMSQY
jgi:hypothetical protein